MKKRICIAVCLLFAFGIAAGSFAESTPRIWRVTDGDGHCIYMLGTVHVSVPEMFPVTGIDEVLDECDTLALEIWDGILPGADTDTSGNDLLGELLSLLGDLLEEVDLTGCGLSREEMKRAAELIDIPAWTLSFLNAELVNGLVQVVLMEQAGVNCEYGVEEYLVELAAGRRMRIIGLETEEFQSALLASQSRESLAWETGVILQYAEAYKESVLYTLECWRNGTDEVYDEDEIEELTPDDPKLCAEMEEYDRRLTEERNVSFLADAEGFLARGDKVLIAIGDAHVSDPGGLAELLTQRGYTVELISPIPM